MKLTRVYRFSASHRLHSPDLSSCENQRLYGKCNNPYGHGHNYVLHVSVTGEPEQETGRVVEPGKLDRFVSDRVLRALDHKDMNADVEDFAHRVPTTENLAVIIECRLREGWDAHFGGPRLAGISIEETPRNTFKLPSI